MVCLIRRNGHRTNNFEHLNEIDDCKEEAHEIYALIVTYLGVYKISEHHGNLFYIIMNYLELEGSLNSDCSGSIKWAKSKLISLLRLLKIRDTGLSKDIKIEFSHKSYSNRNFPEYTVIDDLSTIKALIDLSIPTMFQVIKAESLNVNPVLSFILEDIITPTSTNISDLVKPIHN